MNKIFLFKIAHQEKFLKESSFFHQMSEVKKFNFPLNSIIITNKNSLQFIPKNIKNSNSIIVLNYNSVFQYQNYFFLKYSNQTEINISNSILDVLLKGLLLEKINLTSNLTTDKIKNLINLIKVKDLYTYEHSLRVADTSSKIGRTLDLDEEDIKTIYNAALLHDIGKIGIPDSILLKHGRLNDEEYSFIKKHAELSEFLLMDKNFEKIRPIIRFHHEWYDGHGYPLGLIGEEIPPFSRIISLADSYDAMTSKRLYGAQKDDAKSIKEIHRFSGTQFDPNLVDTIINVIESEKKAKKKG